MFRVSFFTPMIALSLILASAQAFAGSFSMKPFSGRIANYSDVPSKNLTVAFFWMYCPKSSEGCVSFENDWKVDEEGKFSIPKFSTGMNPSTDRSWSLIFRVYEGPVKDGNPVGQIEVPASQADIESAVSLVSVYKLPKESLKVSLTSGVDSTTWVQNVARESQLIISYVVDGKSRLSRVRTGSKYRSYLEIAPSWLLVSKDLGKAPKGRVESKLYSTALREFPGQGRLFSAIVEDVSIAAGLPQRLKEIKIDDTQLPKTLDRAVSGVYSNVKVNFTPTQGERATGYGTLTLKCDSSGALSGVYEIKNWTGTGYVDASAKIGGKCSEENETANIQFDISLTREDGKPMNLKNCSASTTEASYFFGSKKTLVGVTTETGLTNHVAIRCEGESFKTAEFTF